MLRSFLALVLALAALAAHAPAQLAFGEILVDPVGADDGFELVELTNFGPGVYTTTGNESLCVQDGATTVHYWLLPAGVSLAVGESMVIHWRGFAPLPPLPVNHFYTGTAPANFLFNTGSTPLDATGAIGLYSTPQFTNPAAMMDFVQWGGSGHLRETIANAAGEWVSGTFVATPPEGMSLAYDGSGDTAGDWFIDPSPTFGAANPILPGNGADVGVGIAVNGTPVAGDAATVNAGDLVSFTMSSPGGSLDGSPLLVIFEDLPTGASFLPLTIPGDFVGASVHTTGSPFIMVDGLSAAGALFSPVLLPGGYVAGGTVPASLGGINRSVNVQALCLDPTDPVNRPFGIGVSDAVQLAIN
ncbi:MAG: hypothetical protein R3F20_04100 [Planctomycetota bacterium]